MIACKEFPFFFPGKLKDQLCCMENYEKGTSLNANDLVIKKGWHHYSETFH